MSDPSGIKAREYALDALVRINEEGAYANILVPRVLERSDLDARDRGLVTELVYGATRARRACDWLVDRFLFEPVEPRVRAALQMGAYQLVHLEKPPHAAVSTTVGASPKRARGLVNAVLRRVAEAPIDWPDDGTWLSYPDWIIERLVDDLGDDDAIAALKRMNRAAEVSTRPDGYVQDRASQFVVAAVGAERNELVLDVCAAPGGKATAMAETGAHVVAADRRPKRVVLVRDNSGRLGYENVAAVAADGNQPPFRPRRFDRVLVDAPCSGLGVLRRRPDARWRVTEDAVDRLAVVQLDLLTAAADLVRPGGTLVYSVCTLTRRESLDVVDSFTDRRGDLEAVPPGDPWRPWGSGGMLLPQDQDTDGMVVFRWKVG
ncbi:MAG: hypothetical protein OEU32_03025 [Acidimicrobiia bacterium]|nr:hypothetical protein [Acidimicrobiia bacterium]